MVLKHLIESQQLTKEILFDLFKRADELREKCDNCLENKILAALFYEPSTRTRLSFESAMLRLGGRVIGTENAKEFSSAVKGESLEDSIRVIADYSDVIVIRHPEEGTALRASQVSRVPIINAGDGKGQHPTQALLDMFTIDDEIGSIDGLKIVLSGDLKNGRTVHSLAYLLGKFNDVKIYFASPPGLEIPENILDYLKRHNIEYLISDSLKTVIEKVPIDVVYQTRIQRERMITGQENFERYKNEFILTRELVKKLHNDAIILHPLPRIDEIRYGVDDDHRAKYFKQAENGLYVRMALLKTILK